MDGQAAQVVATRNTRAGRVSANRDACVAIGVGRIDGQRVRATGIRARHVKLNRDRPGGVAAAFRRTRCSIRVDPPVTIHQQIVCDADQSAVGQHVGAQIRGAARAFDMEALAHGVARRQVDRGTDRDLASAALGSQPQTGVKREFAIIVCAVRDDNAPALRGV